jgi:mRNA interferase MazF
MKSGDIILASLPQADGKTKLRPALVLKVMLPYKDLLVCGISTQIHQEVNGLDEIISNNDIDFNESGLIQQSLIRVGYLAIIPNKIIAGIIGKISVSRLQKIKKQLAEFIQRD